MKNDITVAIDVLIGKDATGKKVWERVEMQIPSFGLSVCEFIDTGKGHLIAELMGELYDKQARFILAEPVI